MKKRKFPQDVARFFHPEKSINPKSSGIHQIEKASQRSLFQFIILWVLQERFTMSLAK